MTALTIKIRAYRQADFSDVMTVFKRNVPTYFSESETNDLEEFLKSSIELYFIAETEKAIIGAGGINFEDTKKVGVISWDFIDPDFQGKGIGKKLLTHRIDLLRAMDSIEKIKVRTSQLTFQFYEKSGFITQKIVKDYWAKGFDLYDMVLEQT